MACSGEKAQKGWYFLWKKNAQSAEVEKFSFSNSSFPGVGEDFFTFLGENNQKAKRIQRQTWRVSKLSFKV